VSTRHLNSSHKVRRFSIATIACAMALCSLWVELRHAASAQSNTPGANGPIYSLYDPPGGFHPGLEFQAAPAGHYLLDPDHAHLTFQLEHYGGLSRPQLRFRDVQAEYTWDPAHPEATKVEARISPTSIDGHNRDFEVRMNAPDVLRGYDPSEGGKYRYFVFESTAIKFTGKDSAGRHIGVMNGELTIHGTTKPIIVQFTYNGYLQNRLGFQKMGFSAATSFKRSDFGITSEPSAGDQVDVTMEFEFMRSADGSPPKRVEPPPR
jgi:polyisoprenoid-binding protein YceI